MCGRNRVVARASVAEKSMISVGNFDIRIFLFRFASRVRHRLHLIRTDALIFAAPKQEHRDSQLSNSV
jgi:hypothetical protein